MPIRLSKSGSTLRLGATALVASASLWFGSAVYAQTQPAPQMGTFPLSSQTQPAYAQQPLSHSQARRVTTERLPSNTNFDFKSGRFLSPTVAPVTPAAQRAPRTTERLDAGNLSDQAVLNLLGHQARSNVQTVPTHVTAPVQSSRYQSSVVATVESNGYDRVPQRPSGRSKLGSSRRKLGGSSTKCNFDDPI